MGPEMPSSVKIVRVDDLKEEIQGDGKTEDRIEPLRDFTNENERKKVKAKRRRSIATPSITSIQEKSGKFSSTLSSFHLTALETPVKEDKPNLPNLENLLTPETDEENSTEGLPIKESAKRCFPYQVLFT